MAETTYKDINTFLSRYQQSGFPQVFLLFGEESLYKSLLQTVVKALLPEHLRAMCYDALDGTEDTVYDAIERINTFSLTDEKKVVALCDSRIFYSKDNEEILLQKVKEAYDLKDLKKASKLMASLLAVLKLSFDDVCNSDQKSQLKIDFDQFGDEKWFNEVISYGRDNHIPIKTVRDSAADLEKAIEKGFPNDHFLIITTDIADSKKSLYEAINKKGLIVNCVVPKGDRKADKDIQNAVLSERAKSVLAPYGKKISPQAFQAMFELMGFDLRNFTNSLEKLAQYVGGRSEITLQDVESLLSRTKQDPLYELTNAVSEKNAADSILYIQTLMNSGYYPLQLLSAIANQIRKLLIIKEFVESSKGKAWRSKMSYDQFQAVVMPTIAEHDKSLIAMLENWDKQMSQDEEQAEKKKSRRKKSDIDTDLVIAKNPKSPYPVYLAFIKSDRFTKQELIAAMHSFSHADIQMKSTGKNPKIILEQVILRLCNVMQPQELFEP